MAWIWLLTAMGLEALILLCLCLFVLKIVYNQGFEDGAKFVTTKILSERAQNEQEITKAKEIIPRETLRRLRSAEVHRKNKP